MLRNTIAYAKVETNEVEPCTEVELPEAKLVDEALIPSFQVVAPSNLEPGFEFAVTFEGVTYLATVPEDGARVGCHFTPINVHQSDVRKFPLAGAWTAGLFDCVDHPWCGGAWWCGSCVKPYLLGIIANRLQGLRDSHVGGWVLAFVLNFSYLFMRLTAKDQRGHGADDDMTTPAVFGFVLLCALATLSALTCLIRRQVRQRLAIRGNEGEDCLLSWCCNLCVILQMHSQVENMTTAGTPIIGRIEDRLAQPIKPKTKHHPCLEATIV